jgi:YD repeat-containing protein
MYLPSNNWEKGRQLASMTMGADTLTFTYDASGNPQTVTYGGTTYYYVTNLQGDVIAILNSAGTKVVSYTYDAWGNSINIAHSMASTLGTP